MGVTHLLILVVLHSNDIEDRCLVQQVSTYPSAQATYLLTIHLLFSRQFHLIYYTTENDHFWVEGAP